MKENAILIRQIDVLKVFVDFDDPNGIEKVVGARRVSTIHTIKTQELSNKLSVHLVGYVDREGNDINNERACQISGYDYLGSFMLLCKTDDKFNNYGFSEEELDRVYTYLTTGKIKLDALQEFVNRYDLNIPLPMFGVKPKVYYKEDVPYMILLRYDLSSVLLKEYERIGTALFQYSSALLEECTLNEKQVNVSKDGKWYLKTMMDGSFYNLLIQARGDDEEEIILINDAKTVVDGFLGKAPTSENNPHDMDTAMEEAID